MGRALVVRLMGGASVIVCSSLSKCVCVCVWEREIFNVVRRRNICSK